MDLLTGISSHKILMGSNCTRYMVENLREELWSYFALSGLLFLNIGIVLVVYGLKKATTHAIVVEVYGVGLIITGILATLASWYVHRQHRQRKPLCSCTFCCWQTLDNNDISSEASENGCKEYHPRLSWRESVRDQTKSTETSVRMFSTIEFQTYAEYVKRDTLGVQARETRKDIGKFKEEVQRHKKQVYPHRSAKVRHAAMFVNAGYTHTELAIPHLVATTNPSLLQPIKAVSQVVLQTTSVSPAALVQPTSVNLAL